MALHPGSLAVRSPGPIDVAVTTNPSDRGTKRVGEEVRFTNTLHMPHNVSFKSFKKPSKQAGSTHVIDGHVAGNLTMVLPAWSSSILGSVNSNGQFHGQHLGVCMQQGGGAQSSKQRAVVHAISKAVNPWTARAQL